MNRLSGTLADVLNEVIDSLSQVEEDIIDAALHRLAAYEDTGLTPEEIAELRKAHNRQYETLAFLLTEADGVETQHLRDLLIAEHEGRLVITPCKVGDVVYCIHQGTTILPMVAKWFETNDDWTVCVQYTPMAPKFFRFADFGKTIFLTLEEAEAALKGGAAK